MLWHHVVWYVNTIVLEETVALIFRVEDKGSRSLQNVGTFLPDYMLTQPRRHSSSYPLPRELQISNKKRQCSKVQNINNLCTDAIINTNEGNPDIFFINKIENYANIIY